jgi:Zn-dependent peptidase ImmA (M78 family)
MKVKIGTCNYNLKINKAIRDLGLCNPQGLEIVINPSSAKEYNEQVLMHEISHAIMIEIGEEELYHNEEFIDRLGKQLHFFIKNNNVEKLFNYVGEL